MSDRAREHFILASLLIFAAIVFAFGITWGLPSRKTDAYLFGDRTPWTGAQILALAPPRNSEASDVDGNPAVRGSVVNDTDARRAEIVRRYRLFTYQPDEMITMMSLAQMHPSAGDFDPRLYQYGGLWIYPVGGLIKLLLHPVADPAYYLDHPEQFANFYVVARAYAAAWGVIGAWAVYRLVRGNASRGSAILATLLYATMPVVVNMAHEAKPHLPGTALMLLAALSASRYVRRGGWGNFILVSTLCGAAAGMILSAGVAILIAATAVVLRVRRIGAAPCPLSPVRGEGSGEGVDGPVEESASFQQTTVPPHPLPRVRGSGDQKAFAELRAAIVQIAAAIAIAALVYYATNPYVLKHLLTDRSVLSANLANTKAMYHVDPIGGVVRAIELIGAGASWPIVVVGFVQLFWKKRTADRSPTGRIDAFTGRTPALTPLIACCLAVAIQFAALAAGKPGEYARFALIIDVTLALLAAMAVDALSNAKVRSAAIVILLMGTMLPSAFYEYGFWSDSRNVTRRDRLAKQLAELNIGGDRSLGIWNEPAPYLLPPVDLWKWQIQLLPREIDLVKSPTDVIVRSVDRSAIEGFDREYRVTRVSNNTPLDDVGATLISWANKPIEIWESAGGSSERRSSVSAATTHSSFSE